MVEVWATVLPSSVKASIAFSLVSSSVNSSEFIPSMRFKSGLATSKVQVVIWNRSLSTALASVFLWNRDSDAVKISWSFGVLVRTELGTGYFPCTSFLSALESVEVMAVARMTSISSDNLAVLLEHACLLWSSQPNSASGGMSRTVSVLKCHSAGLEQPLPGLLGREEGVLELGRLWAKSSTRELTSWMELLKLCFMSMIDCIIVSSVTSVAMFG